MKYSIISCFFIFLIIGCSQEKSNKETQNTVENKTEITKPDNSKKGLMKQISQLEDSLYASQVLDKKLGNRAIAMYQNFHKYYWQDTVCVEYLFKAGEIADNMGFPQKAIELYQDCCDYYPDHSLAPLCLYQIGNIYNFKLNDFTNARDAYNGVHKYYPNTPYAKDALAAMKTLITSDKQLIEEFEKKNGIKRK
jgi:TolA-binding protein